MARKQNADTPFFLYFAPVAIHFPYTPSDKTKGKSGTGLYGDWIHELDLSVGRILDAIDRMKATEETLVIFTSDNGGVLMTEGTRPEAEAYRAGLRCNGDLRGRKHSIYEGGFRVPFLVRWPGHVQPGTVCDETINLVDIYATLAAVIDQPLRPDEDVAEDSFNVLAAMLGTPHEEPLRPSMIVHSPNGNFAIRRGPWKFIEGKPSPTLKRVPRRDELHAQLYNLQDDPGEKHNVINKHPDVVNRLASLLEQQRTDGRSSTRYVSTRKHQMNKHLLSFTSQLLLAFLLVIALSAGTQAADDRPPNVVLLFADDLGYGDLGCYGHPYARTPAIDQLAKEGTRFTQFYVTGVTCNPSRTGLMTGLFPARFPKYAADFGFGDRSTITELLKKRGYRTGHFGKWHIGPDDSDGTYGIDTVKTIGKSRDRSSRYETTTFIRPRLTSSEKTRTSRSTSTSGATRHTFL